MELTGSALVVLLAVLAVVLFGARRRPGCRAGVAGCSGAPPVPCRSSCSTCSSSPSAARCSTTSTSSTPAGVTCSAPARRRCRCTRGDDRRASSPPRSVVPACEPLRSPTPCPPLPQPGSRLQTYTVIDTRSHSGGQVLVAPPRRLRPARGPRYPVVIGLHGFPGVAGQLRPPQLPQQHRRAHRGAQDGPDDRRDAADRHPGRSRHRVRQRWPGPAADRHLALHDLPAWTVAHFRVSTARTSWATVGYSYGAWCAASLTMRHPDVFGAAVSLQGYFRPDFGVSYDPLSASALRGYDLVALAGAKPPPVALWVLTSREDPLSFPTTSKFLSVARPPLDVTAVVLAHGGPPGVPLHPPRPGRDGVAGLRPCRASVPEPSSAEGAPVGSHRPGSCAGAGPSSSSPC